MKILPPQWHAWCTHITNNAKGILPGIGKVNPAGSRGTITAGWFLTRAKKFSEGSGKTISLYDSTTTGFLVDWGPVSSSGYNFKLWYLHKLLLLVIKLQHQVNQGSNTDKYSQVQLLITDIVVEDKSNDNFEFTPTTLWQLKRRWIYHSGRVIETGMQLKYNSLYHHSKIFIGCPTYIDCPLMWLRPKHREGISDTNIKYIAEI